MLCRICWDDFLGLQFHEKKPTAEDSFEYLAILLPQYLSTVGITFDTTLINMHESLKALSKVMVAHRSAPCQGESRMTSRSLPLKSSTSIQLPCPENKYLKTCLNAQTNGIQHKSMVNRGGSRIPRTRERQPSKGPQHTILPNFPKNWIKS